MGREPRGGESGALSYFEGEMMGRMGEAYVADIERRALNGEFENAPDPYDFHVACEALEAIARGVSNPASIALTAIVKIRGGFRQPDTWTPETSADRENDPGDVNKDFLGHATEMPF